MPSPPVELLVKTTTTATRAVAVGERREGRPRQIVFNIYDTRGACLVRSLGRVMELQAVGRSTPEDGAPDEIEFDIETQVVKDSRDMSIGDPEENEHYVAEIECLGVLCPLVISPCASILGM